MAIRTDNGNSKSEGVPGGWGDVAASAEDLARVATMGNPIDSPTAAQSKLMRSKNVYECIAAVSAEIAKTGIAKDRQNAQQGYKFRGIDEVLNALAPLLAKHRLVILPRILARQCVERVSKSGSAQFFVIVEAEFVFVSAEDGSQHVVRTFGEAQDSGDKATNKAMSAAYKYAAFLAFCIPTEGDNDADATTAEPTRVSVPPGFDHWIADIEAVAEEGTPALEAAWKKSQPFLRKFLTDTDPARWDRIKKKAGGK